MKDRPAVGVLLKKIRSGEPVPYRSAVLQSSSGDRSVQICRYYGPRFICVVDAKTTARSLSVLKAYQAVVEIVTQRDPDTYEYLPQRLRRV
jgi:N-(2-amino-2-carboxyethyl)-L-glutamate synthase